MATNVTTDTKEYLTFLLDKESKYLEESTQRIEKYNNVTIPAKEANFARMNAKKAEEGKAPIEYDLTPIDPETSPVHVGLKNAVRSYQIALDCINGEFKESDADGLDNAIKLMESKLKSYTYKLKASSSRLNKAREKRVNQKLQNPKKYSKRPDIPEGDNREVINNKIYIEHYTKILKALYSAKEGITK